MQNNRIMWNNFTQKQNNIYSIMHNNTESISQPDFIFPVPFGDFIRIRSAEKIDYTVKDYHQIFRLKKMLQQTENKIANRINLFKNSSKKLMKTKDRQRLIVQQNILNKENTINSRTGIQSRDSIIYQKLQNIRPILKQESNGLKSQKSETIINLKISNARNMKLERQKYRQIIQQKKKVQLTRKLQSAQYIRKNREIAKINKIELQRHKKEQYNNAINRKVIRQKQMYLELQKNLQTLQIEQRQALINWKKTLDYQ